LEPTLRVESEGAPLALLGNVRLGWNWLKAHLHVSPIRTKLAGLENMPLIFIL